MKICHLGPTALPVVHDRGGAVQRRMLELAAQQAGAGHDVRLLSADETAGQLDYRGARVLSLAVRTRRPVRDYEYLLRARHHLRDEPADVVHVHGVPEAARVLRGCGARIVLSFDYFAYRGSERRLGWKHYRRSLERFDRILPVSASCGDMAAEYWRYPRSRMRVLPNGVNLEQFRPDDDAGRMARRRFGLDDRPIALYVGRLCEQKGTDLLLDAWESLGEQTLRWQLVLAGPVGQFGMDGPSELVTRIERLGGTWLGAVEESILGAIYNASDVFVMPTRHAEMFGMAALEAESCGKPVVASRWGGLTEAVSEDAGVFFPPNDARSLAQAMAELLDNPEQRSRLGKAARAHAETYDWREVAATAAAIYDEVGAR